MGIIFSLRNLYFADSRNAHPPHYLFPFGFDLFLAVQNLFLLGYEVQEIHGCTMGLLVLFSSLGHPNFKVG